VAHLRWRRIASKAVNDDILDRLHPRRRDIRRIDPEPPRHPRTRDKTPLLNDRISPHRIRVMEEKLIPGTGLELSQSHGRTVSTRSDVRVCAADPRPKSTLSACLPRRLFRLRERSRRVSRSEERGGLGGGETDRPDGAFPEPFQAPAVASWWLWSFSRLWVAVISRHSERAADRPRRWKRSMRRLNFVCPNTGSIIAWRFR
jgi:hypothetical protein